ncbi:MAG: hypothetical protein ACT443_04090 [Gemmatimonadota bacterium]
MPVPFRSGMLATLCIAWLATPGSPESPNTVVTVRVLVKSATKASGVAKTEWLPGSGYFVKVGDARNPARFCNSLHLDPPARVECAVPSGPPVTIRIERADFSGRCPEPFATTRSVPLSVTVRVDSDRRTLACKAAP